LHPKKAFILGGIEKEMRLSFAKRVRDTLPPAYHVLIPASKDNEIPDFKYNDDTTPHSAEAKKLIPLLKKKAPDSEIEAVLKAISDLETTNAAADPSLAATDAFVTAICYIGSKSLSHVLSYIERCKDRLTAIGHASPASRAQIISSVIAFWRDVQAGVAVNIVDKLLNYTILTPSSVIQWALDAERIDGGRLLAETWIYEMVDRTMNKVVGRVRQVCAGRMQILPPDQAEVYDQALKEEVKAMGDLFAEVDDALAGVAEGASTGMLEDMDTTESDEVKADVELATQWGVKWRRVWQRRRKVEATRLREAEKVFPAPMIEEIKEEETKNGNSLVDVKGGEDEII
jgi:nuclear cap-binding protein subunit 1